MNKVSKTRGPNTRPGAKDKKSKLTYDLSGFYDPRCDNMNVHDLPLTLCVAVDGVCCTKPKKWTKLNPIDRIAIPNQ